MDISNSDMEKILSLVPEWERDLESIVMTELPYSENLVVFNGANKLDLYRYAEEIYNETLVIYNRESKTFVRKEKGSRFRLLPPPIKPIKMFSHGKDKVIFMKITGVYICMSHQVDCEGMMTTTYYFPDKQTFNRCIDHLHASRKYKLVGNYRPRIIAQKCHICSLCDPVIYDRIDQWYNCGKWNTTWDPVTDAKKTTTYEDFIAGGDGFNCDLCG